MSEQESRCPSRLQLDRLLHSECTVREAEHLRLHLSGCPRCSGWLERARSREQDLLRSVDVKHLAEGVSARLRPAARRRSPVLGWLGERRVQLAAAAAACLVLVVAGTLLWPGAPARAPTAAGTAVKGTSSLRIYCRRGGRVFQLEPHEHVRSGDALRLEVFSEHQRYMLALAIQADGQVSIYVPFGGGQSRRIESGSKQLIEGSIVMDDSRQDELLVVVLSVQPVPAALARQRARQALARAGSRLGEIRRLDLPGEQHLRLLLWPGGDQ